MGTYQSKYTGEEIDNKLDQVTKEYGCFAIETPTSTTTDTELTLTSINHNLSMSANNRIVLKANKAYLLKVGCRAITFKQSDGLLCVKAIKADGTEITKFCNYCPVTVTSNMFFGDVETIAKFNEDTEIKIAVQVWTNITSVSDLRLIITEF